MVRCHAICYLCRDNYIRRQLSNKMAIAKRKLFTHPINLSPCSCSCKLPLDVKKNDVRVSLTNNNNHSLWGIQLFCDAYDKIVFDFRCCIACLLWTPSRQNLYDNLCNSNSYDWFFLTIHPCMPALPIRISLRNIINVCIVDAFVGTFIYTRCDESTVRMLTEKAYGIHSQCCIQFYFFFGRR